MLLLWFGGMVGTDGEVPPPAHAGGVGHLPSVDVDVPLGPTSQDLLERDAPFEPRQRGAETEVQPVPERQVRALVAVEVELGPGSVQ